MNVGMGTEEATKFIFWEYINGTFVAVQRDAWLNKRVG
jgi:hypothetical protein